jgi:hypothetical protein
MIRDKSGRMYYLKANSNTEAEKLIAELSALRYSFRRTLPVTAGSLLVLDAHCLSQQTTEAVNADC